MNTIRAATLQMDSGVAYPASLLAELSLSSTSGTRPDSQYSGAIAAADEERTAAAIVSCQ